MQSLTGEMILGNDERSFEALCAQYRGHIHRAALALTNSPDDAADLVQETLIRAYRYFHNFEPGSNFRAWALRILHNTHISMYRQRKRYQNVLAWEEVAEHGESRLEDGANDCRIEPEHQVLDDMPDEEVQNALDTLPDSFRTVVELADLGECSYAEISESLGLPIGTVRSRLFRARQRLRGTLSDYALRNGYIKPEDLETVSLAA